MGYYLTRHVATTTRCVVCLTRRGPWAEYPIPCCIGCWDWMKERGYNRSRMLEDSQRVNAKYLQEPQRMLS